MCKQQEHLLQISGIQYIVEINTERWESNFIQLEWSHEIIEYSHCTMYTHYKKTEGNLYILYKFIYTCKCIQANACKFIHANVCKFIYANAYMQMYANLYKDSDGVRQAELIDDEVVGYWIIARSRIYCEIVLVRGEWWHLNEDMREPRDKEGRKEVQKERFDQH